MKRFGWLSGIGGWIVGIVGTGLAVIAFVQRYIPVSLESILLMLVTLGIFVLLLMLSAFERDIDERIDEIQSDLVNGFDDVVNAIENNNIQPDGGEHQADENSGPGDIEPSGGGALGGMVAGGALGSAFGPAGVILGGILGGLLGNEVEYQNLKEEEQEKLKNAAWDVIQRYIGLTPRNAELTHIEDPRNTPNGTWRFTFVDQYNNERLLEFNPDSSNWELLE